MKKTRIIIADDHVMIAEAWKFLLNTLPQYEVVKTYDNAATLLEELEAIVPDVILLDINMQPMNGFEAATAIKKVLPDVKIVCVTMHDEQAFVRRMLACGASAYVTKNAHQREMFKAIDEALAGNIYICEEVKSKMK